MLNRPPTLFGRIKEGCEDFLIGLEGEFKEMFPTSKDEIMDDLRRTRDAARETYNSTSGRLREQYASTSGRLREEFRNMKRDFQTEASDEFNDLVRSCRDFRSQRGFTVEEDTEPIAPPTEPNFKEQVRRYESDLRSTVYVSELNKTVEEKLPSSAELVAYYESRPELTEYTVKKELHRMNYTVFTHEGKKLTTPAEIEAYHATKYHSQGGNNEILWRAANQSLLGDIVVALTSRTSLIRPQLESATFVSDLTMVLDFARDQPSAVAECFLNLSIPGLQGERLPLAGVLVRTYFCPDDNKFRAKISHVFPSATLCEAQVNGAVRALLH